MAVGIDYERKALSANALSEAGTYPDALDVDQIRGSFNQYLKTVGLFSLIAASVAIGLWGAENTYEFCAYFRDNDLSRLPTAVASPLRLTLTSLIVAASVSTVLYVGLSRARAALYCLARWSSPLLLSAFLPALFSWRLWVGRDLTHLIFAASLILFTKHIFYYALTAPAAKVSGLPILGRAVERCRQGVALFPLLVGATPRALGLLCVLLGVLWYVIFFSYHTIVHHYNVLSASFDLGLEENIIYNALHLSSPILKSSPLGGPSASHLGSHATWFAFLIAPIYAIWPKTETLLILQALLMGAAAIPLFLLAKRFLSTAMATLVAALYLLYPGLHGANLYDFHYLPLGPFFLWFTFYFIERKCWVRAVLFALISLSVREDVAVSLGFLGGLWLLAGRRAWASLSALILGAVYFVVMKGIVMHRAFGGDAFVHQYKLLIPEGEHGFGGVIKTILSNPLYTLGTMIEEQKLVYFLQIMLPLACFPLRRIIGLWAAVPGLLFALLSTQYPPLLMISFQYTTYWTAQLFPVTILNLHWMEQRVQTGAAKAAWQWSWLAAIVMGCLSITHQYGALLQHNTTVGGFGRYHFGVDVSDLKRRESLDVLKRQIPRFAKIVSTENVVPQFADRPDSYTLRIGVFDADFIIFRLPTSGDERRHVVDALAQGTFGIVQESGEFVLAKRGHSTEKNEQYIARMGGRHHGED